jgi:glycosyltransferase involved in cell wall biosynthesis
MNILFADQFSEPGGAQLALMDLLPAICARGWKPYVTVPGKGHLAQWCEDQGITVLPLPLGAQSNREKTAGDVIRFPADVFRMRWHLGRIVRQHQIGLVYINGPRVLPPAVGLNRPVIFHIHSDVQNNWGNRLRRWSVESTAARVIAVSRYAAREFPRATVLYNGVADHWSGSRVFGTSPARVAMLGRIAPEKGHLDFVRAAERVSDPARFSVYGDEMFSNGDYAVAVRREAEGAPIQFHGWQNNVTEVLRNVDILAVPSSSREASTRVIMEAFSAGVPVVAYPSGGIPELIRHGVTGILTQSSDPAALAQSLSDLSRNPALMQKISEAAREEWQTRFRRDTFQRAVCEVIESVCQATNSGHDPTALQDFEYRHDSTRAGSRDPVR